MDYTLSEEQNLLIETTKSFVKNELMQHEELLEKTNYMMKLSRNVAKLAFMLVICQKNMGAVV